MRHTRPSSTSRITETIATKTNRRRFAVVALLVAVAGIAYFWMRFSRSAVDVNALRGLSQSTLEREIDTSGRSSDQQLTEQNAIVTTSSIVSSTDVLPTREFQRREALHRESLDPSRDGWDTEALAELAKKNLNSLGDMLVGSEKTDGEVRKPIATDDVKCTPLRPSSLVAVYEDEVVSVQRGERLADMVMRNVGLDGLARAIEELREPFRPAQDVHVKFKIFRVETDANTIKTKAYYLASGSTATGKIQQNATWQCVWQIHEDKALRLRSVQVDQYEEIHSTLPSKTWFTDCTDSVLGGNACYHEQLVHGTDYWKERLEHRLDIHHFGHKGLAIGDVNGDGLDDVYRCEPGGLPNLLLVQNPNGGTTDMSHSAGVDYLDDSMSALLVDLDNDGDQDLVVYMRELLFLANDGTGRFELRSKLRLGTSGQSLSAADYDQDGDLDIFVCMYADFRHPNPMPYYDATNGDANVLLRNDGDWSFKDVTHEVGLDENNTRFSFAGVWEDYDNDGDLDLYVANDFGRNNLYRQDEGRFVDVAAQAGVEDSASGMSVTWGDYNGDGLMDLYVSNMFSAAGGRITYQRQFQQAASDHARADMQRHARGNSLFLNQGDGTFRDVSEEAGVVMGRWAWASLLCDLNNDGWQDIFVANGYVTGSGSDDL